MATLAEIRDAIKVTVQAAVPRVKVYPRIESVVNAPAAVVYPADTDYLVVMGRATVRWEFDVFVLAPAADDELGQYALDAMVDSFGSSSIVAALHGEDLDLPATNCVVVSMSNYGGRFDAAGIDHIGARLRVIVHTSGTS